MRDATSSAVRILILASTLASVLAAQTPATPPAFDVASVKPTAPDQRGLHQLTCSSGTGFVARDQPLLSLIVWAYDFPYDPTRVQGGPTWMPAPASGFDIYGKVERQVTFAQCRQMLQSLLADRFKMTLHRETRELPVYVLSVGSKGSKLKEGGDDPQVMSRVTINGDQIQLRDGFATTATGRGMSMREFARFLTTQPVVGRPVIDKTGLPGFYGFSLDYAWTLDDTTHPDIFAALQEQLGLKLEAAKGPVEILVIDHVERPSAN